jgi:hypothetical protein
VGVQWRAVEVHASPSAWLKAPKSVERKRAQLAGRGLTIPRGVDFGVQHDQQPLAGPGDLATVPTRFMPASVPSALAGR